MLTATLLVAALIGASIATRLTVWALLPAILFVLSFTVVTGISLHWDSTWILLAEVINVVGLELAYLSTSLIFCRKLGQARTANRRKLSTRPTLFGEIRAGGQSARGGYRGKRREAKGSVLPNRLLRALRSEWTTPTLVEIEYTDELRRLYRCEMIQEAA